MQINFAIVVLTFLRASGEGLVKRGCLFDVAPLISGASASCHSGVKLVVGFVGTVE